MCSIFARKTAEGVLIGRNFDWLQQGGTIHFIPSQRVYGTQMHSLFLIEQMGSDRVYEGINEKGVFMGCAAIPVAVDSAINFQQLLHIDELGAIRFVLERASTTQEAIALLDVLHLQDSFLEYKIRLHFLIVDKNANSCVYQIGQKNSVKPLNNINGEAITNFSHYEKSSEVCWRYNAIGENIQHVDNMSSAMRLLKKIKQDITIWSSVFNLNTLQIWLCIEQDYSFKHKFVFQDELSKGYTLYDFATLKLMNPAVKTQFTRYL